MSQNNRQHSIKDDLALQMESGICWYPKPKTIDHLRNSVLLVTFRSLYIMYTKNDWNKFIPSPHVYMNDINWGVKDTSFTPNAEL